MEVILLAKVKVSDNQPISSSRRRPAMTPEAREQQMISLAMDEVELRIRNHTATSQELCHFLKLGTSIAKLEKKKLEAETKLANAKCDAVDSQKDMGLMYKKALDAMMIYKGEKTRDEVEEDYDEDYND